MFSGIIVQRFPQVTDEESECLSAFFGKNSYLRGRYDDDNCFAQLSAHLSSLPGGADASRLFYLALPPTVYREVSTNIRAHCMSHKSVSVILAKVHKNSGLLAIWSHYSNSYVCNTEDGTGSLLRSPLAVTSRAHRSCRPTCPPCSQRTRSTA